MAVTHTAVGLKWGGGLGVGLGLGWGEGCCLPVLVCVAGVSHQVIVNIRLKQEFGFVIDVRV